MRAVLAAALFMFSSAGFMALAAADQPFEKSARAPYEKIAEPVSDVQTGDARSVASDQEVGVARRAYRAQCLRYESPGFCECVTAGVAQALSPSDVRLAARTIRERIGAQGDAADSADTDHVSPDAAPMTRVEQVEGYYASACRENVR
jgi:hypothetical protein